MSRKSKAVVTVVSSFANDAVLNKQGQVVSLRRGGPAYFVKNIFEQEKIKFDLVVGEEIDVEILVTESGEFGRVKTQIRNQNLGDIKTECLLLSTIVNEWPFMLKKYSGILFIDIQGFVRDPSDFGKKRMISVPKRYRPFCVKGTEQEICYLPLDFIESQKERCLIVTKGIMGSTIFYKRKEFTFKPRKIARVLHTIGAGDTFFALFFAEFSRTHDVRVSGNYATEETILFLEGR